MKRLTGKHVPWFHGLRKTKWVTIVTLLIAFLSVQAKENSDVVTYAGKTENFVGEGITSYHVTKPLVKIPWVEPLETRKVFGPFKEGNLRQTQWSNSAFVLSPPTSPSTNISFSNMDGDRFYTSFTRGDGTRRMIVAKANSPVTAVPVDGVEYLAGDFGAGNEIAPDEFVVYKGNGSGAWIYGLTHSTTYYLKVFEFNGSDFSTEYLTSDYLESNQSTITYPTTQASSLSFSDIEGTKMKVSWTNGNGARRILIARANEPVNVEPEDMQTYSSTSSGMGHSSYQIGTGNYVLYKGTGSSVNISNLQPNVTYHFALFEYNGSSGPAYLTSTSIINPAPGATGSQMTEAYPTVNAKNINFSNFDGDRFYCGINNYGNGIGRLVVAKEGSPVTGVPVDGVEYSASTTFGNGDEIAPGEFVISKTGNTWLYGLQPHTTYHIKVFEFNGSGMATYYLKTTDGNGNPVLEGSSLTVTYPTVQTSDLSFSDIEGTKMKVHWTNGNGARRILIARANEPVNVEPEDIQTYSSTSSGMGNNSYQIGTGNYVLYKGTGSSVNISNLQPNITYHFAVFEYNGSNVPVYLTSSSLNNPAPGATGNQITNAYPTVNAKNINFSNFDGDRFYCGINNYGNGIGRLVVAKEGSPVTGVPTDGVEYSASTTFGNGDEIAPGEYVISKAGSTWLYGLQPHTTYHIKVFEFNGTGAEIYYLTTDDNDDNPVLQGSSSTVTTPTLQTSNLSFSDIEGTKMRVHWTNGNGARRILIARANEPVNVEPEDIQTYSSTSSGMGNNSYQIGTGNYVLYKGTGNSVNISNLQPNITYHFAVFEYNGSNVPVYLTSSSLNNPAPGATGSQMTNAYPTVNAKNINFSNVDGDRFYCGINNYGNGIGRLVVAKEGSPVTGIPTDGVEYSASTTFGNGDEIAPGEFVISKTGNTWLYGLQPHTTYHIKVFEYNGSGVNTFYLITDDDNDDPVLESSQSTSTTPTVQTNNIFINSKTVSSFNVNWTNGNGQGRILIARANEPVDVEPQDLENYSYSRSGYGNPYYEIGDGNYVLYQGNSVSVNVTNLQFGTNYHFALFEYNGSNAKVYLRPGYTFEAETYGATPTQQVSNVIFSNIGGSSMKVDFTRGNGSARLVIAKKGSPVDVEPVDDITYAANTEFGLGQELGTGNYVVYNGTAQEFQLSNLEVDTTYHLAFFEYAINDENELYLVPGATATKTTAAAPTASPSNFAYSRPCGEDLVINWNAGNGQGRLVVLSEDPLNAMPENGTNYTANFGYGLGDAIGNGYVVYNAAGTMAPPNLLDPAKNYYVNIFEYNGLITDPVFNMTPLVGWVGDVEPPSISCSNIQVDLDENGIATITPEDIGDFLSNNCGPLTAEVDIDSFDCSNLGQNTVTLTVTDLDNNTSTCTSIVTVVDQTPPTVLTKDITVQLASNGTVSIANDAVDEGSTDNCGALTFSTNITNFNSSHIGDNTVILTVTDGSNNSASASAVVTVLDVGAPINDNLCDVIPLTINETSDGDSFTNVGATVQTGEPTGTCWGNPDDLRTVWFSFIAPVSGHVKVTTNIIGGSLASPQLAVYNAITDCNDLASLSDEVGCAVTSSKKAETSISDLNPGEVYYIQVSGANGQAGTFGIEVRDEGCLDPSNIIIEEVSQNSAEISWAAGGSETQWEIVYSDNIGFSPSTEGDQITVNNLPQIVLENLNFNSSYQFYIRSICGTGVEGDWVGPFGFTTMCEGATSLSFLGTGTYANSIVSPTTGAPDTTFEFKVLYTNEDGILPPYGYPRVILDYEGNGVFTNTNDRTIVLTPEDPTDTDPTNGKVYIGSIAQLPSGTNWKSYVQVWADNCMTQVGPFDDLEVLIGPDLEIFANDITFDNPNPDVSSPLTVFATIHNKSDLPAENFVVHLENQLAYLEVYDDITIDYLAPHESVTVSWDIVTPEIPSWNPMEVTVDYTNVIVETNELNNQAVRPFTNGEFEIPGAINVVAQASPSIIQLPQGTYDKKITISGYAYYTDTAVPLQDSTVAGATVTFVSPITGNEHQTYTNASGYFSFRTAHGNQIGEYTAPVEVTDFTISGEDTVNWELIPGPCFPDLEVSFSPYSGRTILEGESATGTVTVKNRGCAPVEVETLLEMTQTGGSPILGDLVIPPLAPNQSVSFEFTLEFDTVGTYYVNAKADAEEVIEEESESNNFKSFKIVVNPPLPDIVPIGGENKGTIGMCNLGEGTGFSLQNKGFVDTDSFSTHIEVYYDDQLLKTYTVPTDNIAPGNTTTLSIPFEYENYGRYDFIVKADIPIESGGVVEEISETNNVKSYFRIIEECVFKPDLMVSSCTGNTPNLNVSPIDPEYPGTVTYSAIVKNNGNAVAEAPIELNFVVTQGLSVDAVYTVIHNDDILPGEQVTVSTEEVAMYESGSAKLEVIVDPNDLIDEWNKSNNSALDNLCFEFEPVPLCGNNFWHNYNQFETAVPRVGLKVNHLYRASEVQVRFEVQEPGSSDWIWLGDGSVQNPTKCHGCPYYVGLSDSFVFNQTGTYTFKMTADPDNEYLECNEANNVLIKTVEVGNRPDMRILSQYIHPSKLNPDPDEAIFFNVSYENIGYSNIGESMDLTLKINNDVHAVVHNAPGLIKNSTHTVAVPVPYSSDIEGLHVARAIIDSNHDVNDSNRSNNEATRSFVVGAAANLYFDNFAASNQNPLVGEEIDVSAYIKNNGELDVDAEVRFSYISHTGDTIAIGTQPILVDAEPDSQNPPVNPIIGYNNIPSGGILVSVPWQVEEMPVTIMGEIINTSELEFDYTDNIASTELSFFEVELASEMSCDQEMGSLTAIVTGGNPPYSYHWSTGETGVELIAGPGIYSVTVIDADGTQTTASGEIKEDPNCMELDCSLSAISFNLDDSCDAQSNTYNTTLVIAYENEPATGFITVNGTDYEITGSPQTFAVQFGPGDLNYEVSFTDSDACSLSILTGVVLENCEEPYACDISLAATVDFSDTCIEEGEYYDVILIVSGGLPDDSFTIVSGSNILTTTAEAGVPVQLSSEWFVAGMDYTFTARRNNDWDCTAQAIVESPEICGEPSDCNISLNLEMDFDENCIEEGGTFNVIATIEGEAAEGAEFTIYDELDGTWSVSATIGEPVTITYNAGESTTLYAVGGPDADCTAEASFDSPEICEDPEVECNISLNLEVDFDEDCIEEGGTFSVIATIEGEAAEGTEFTIYDELDGTWSVSATVGDSVTITYNAGEFTTLHAVVNDEALNCAAEASFESPEICDEGDEREEPSTTNEGNYISKVKFYGIGSDQGNDNYGIDYSSNAMSEGGYGVIEDPNFTIYPEFEAAYNFNSAGEGWTHYRVWVDWNGDGLFTADEEVMHSPIGGIPNGLTGHINFADFDLPFEIGGVYIARIRNSKIDRPEAYGEGDGETLDFTVNVVSEAEANMILGVDSYLFNDFSFYPNPVRSQLNLNAGNLIEQVAVFNLLGQQVIQVKPNAVEAVLDLDRLESGVYLIDVTIEGVQKFFRIIKK